MRITGIDITSSPKPGKPIISVSGTLAAGNLRLDRLVRLTSLADLREHLMQCTQAGPGVIGVDCPLSLPCDFLDAIPELRGKSWLQVMQNLARRTSREVEELLLREKELRAPGQRQLTRRVDRLAGAASPLRVRNEPFTGKMFARLAPIFWELAEQRRVSIPFLTEAPRVAVSLIEIYPGLVARALLPPGARYKNSRGPEVTGARTQMLRRLRSGFLAGRYQTSLEVPEEMANEAQADAGGDILDAILATLQSAWFAQCPPELNQTYVHAVREGWIMDPILVDC